VLRTYTKEAKCKDEQSAQKEKTSGCQEHMANSEMPQLHRTREGLAPSSPPRFRRSSRLMQLAASAQIHRESVRVSLLGCLCRHAATMDSSSPDSLSSHSPLDTPADDVRQRLLFDCHESRFGETAEPDPLSFGSPQPAEHAQHAQQAEQHDLVAMSSSFQVRTGFAMQATAAYIRLMLSKRLRGGPCCTAFALVCNLLCSITASANLCTVWWFKLKSEHAGFQLAEQFVKSQAASPI